MNNTHKANVGPKVYGESAAYVRIALWWLRNYEEIIHFWTGFSWVWVIGVMLAVVVGYLTLSHGLTIILCFGVIASAGAYLGIRAASSYLKHLDDGPEKEEAHALMIEIIKRRIASH